MVLHELAELYKSKHFLSGIFYIHDIGQPRMTSIDIKVRQPSIPLLEPFLRRNKVDIGPESLYIPATLRYRLLLQDCSVGHELERQTAFR